MAHGVVHQFAGGTEEQYRASIAAVHPMTAACRRVRCFMQPARRQTAGRSSLSMTPRRAGNGFATDTDASNASRHRRRLRRAAQEKTFEVKCQLST